MKATISSVCIAFFLLFGLAISSVTPAYAVPTSAPVYYGAPCGTGTGFVSVTNSDNLATVVYNNSPGTTFCLASGTYTLTSTVLAKANDAFIGTSSTRPVIEASAVQNAFDATGGSGVVFRGLVIQDAGNYGIRGGLQMTVSFVKVINSVATGIGGAFTGTIDDCEISYNGSQGLIGDDSGGVKSSYAYTIVNSVLYKNIGVGVWCDEGCAGGPAGSGNGSSVFIVANNAITYTVKSTGTAGGGVGIAMEISPQTPGSPPTGVLNYSGGASISGNVTQNNEAFGIWISSDQNVVVEDNILGSNPSDGIWIAGARFPYPNYDLGYNNTMNGDQAYCITGQTEINCLNNN